MSPDPVKDGLNWYSYCNNNPIKYIDPNGKSPDDAFRYLFEYNNEVQSIAAEYGLKPTLLRSVIWNENKYRWEIHMIKDKIGILSNKNTSLGMCQVQLATAAFLDTNPNPEDFKNMKATEFEQKKLEAYSKLTPEQKQQLIDKLSNNDLANLDYAAKYLKLTSDVAGLDLSKSEDQKKILTTFNRSKASWGQVSEYGEGYLEYADQEAVLFYSIFSLFPHPNYSKQSIEQTRENQ